MAQMRFDSSSYGEAIVYALEALERDPDDTLANSIVAVSGLRVTSKALGDLSKKNNISGNVRTEAQELAKLLRTSLNEQELVGGGHPPKSRADRTDRPARAVGANLPSPSAPPKSAAKSSDPFDVLK
jgi:hypothetical protein